MSLQDSVDFAGAIGKIRIENSDLSRDAKELKKLQVDMLAAGIKQLIPENSVSNGMPVNWKWVLTAKGFAEKYGLIKVALLPQIAANGNIQTLVFMRGGDTRSFCREMNIEGFRTGFADDETAEMQQLEKQFGVVVFEKD